MAVKQRENKFDFFKKPQILTEKQKKISKWLKKTTYTMMGVCFLAMCCALDVANFILKIDDGVYSEINPQFHTQRREEKNKKYNEILEERSYFFDRSKGIQYNENGIVLKPNLTTKEINQYKELTKELMEIYPINDGSITSSLTAVGVYEQTLGKNNIKTKEVEIIARNRIKSFYKDNVDNIQYQYAKLSWTNVGKMISQETYRNYLKIKFVEIYGKAWIQLKNENKNKSDKENNIIYEQEFQKLKEEKASQFDDLFDDK